MQTIQTLLASIIEDAVSYVKYAAENIAVRAVIVNKVARLFSAAYLDCGGNDEQFEDVRKSLARTTRSAIGETDKDTWRKSLASVFSNAGKVLSEHPKRESLAMSWVTGDFTVSFSKALSQVKTTRDPLISLRKYVERVLPQLGNDVVLAEVTAICTGKHQSAQLSTFLAKMIPGEESISE